ncbi:MAG: PilZ domain-containing protein [Planctomycetia bacterium]|nr:PilZ domain-containing protein [Planctomycetia bacterium]
MRTTSLSQNERKQIVQIIENLKQEGEALGRRYRRRPVRQIIWLKRLPRADRPRSAAFRVNLEDVSLKGMGLFSRRHLQKNEFVVAPLQFREGGGMLVLCQIRFCRELPQGGYRVGVEFDETLSDPTGTTRIPQVWLKKAWAAEI